MTARLLASAVALATGLLLAACKDDDVTRPPQDAELDRAYAATSKYQNVNAAIADGYVDAHIVTQSMGRHYLNASLMDDKFEVERPELLVYAPDATGKLQLVSLEYAVPLDKSTTAPSGFAGTGDTWEHSDKYGLWTLHAWIWRDNAAGVFAPMNMAVKLDPGTIEGIRDGDGH